MLTSDPEGSRYKWVALSNTTMGVLVVTINMSILLIALPDIFRGIGIDPLAPGNIGYLLWLIVGGVLAPLNWRLIFLVSVPVGVFGTIWAYLKLRESGVRKSARLDWWGNVTFAVGLVAVLVGITYGIQPYGRDAMGWTNPMVLACILGGAAVLAVFAWVETRVSDPMFHLSLFRLRAFTAGNVASLLAALGRGGLQFILIIWLQGIWLPEHGYDFEQTPLWAGIYMVPLIAGFLVAGPASGWLSDRFGARPFATGGLMLPGVSFLLLIVLPVDFSYMWFALILLLNG